MVREGTGDVLFPEPRKPKVIEYSVKQTYGKLLEMVAAAFQKQAPLFVLGIYNPYAYYKGTDADVIPALERGRRQQVVALIRTSFLKRFESSAEAFRQSCWRLLQKLLAWSEVHAETAHEKAALERWKRKNAKLLGYAPQLDLLSEDIEEDLVPPELLDAVEKLLRSEFSVDEILQDTLQDLEQIADFLEELENFKPSQDKKLTELIKLRRIGIGIAGMAGIARNHGVVARQRGVALIAAQQRAKGGDHLAIIAAIELVDEAAVPVVGEPQFEGDGVLAAVDAGSLLCGAAHQTVAHRSVGAGSHRFGARNGHFGNAQCSSIKAGAFQGVGAGGAHCHQGG